MEPRGKIDAVRIVGTTEDGSQRWVKSLSTRNDAASGVNGFFEDCVEQHIEVIFEDRSFVTVAEKDIQEKNDEH